MVITDLGPLEQAILEAVVAAEVLGLPQDCATLHRLLPGYRTHFRNVEAALSEGRPVRRWLLASGSFFVLRDRADSAVVVAAGRRRAQAAWDRRSAGVRGLSKLPWLEAVAAVGPFAQGYLPEIESPLDLVVIAEGGRADLARTALGVYRRALRRGDGGLRILVVLDADDLALEPTGSVEALLWGSLQPLVGEDAWIEFRRANPWLDKRFPNDHPVQLEVPHLLSERRLDGRLAGLRRAQVGRPKEGLLRSERRSGGLLGRLEERAVRRLGGGADLGVLGALASSAFGDYESRLEAVRTWAFDIEEAEVEEADIEEAEVEEADIEEAEVEEAEVEETELEVEETELEVEEAEVEETELEVEETELEVEDADTHSAVRGSQRERGADRRRRGGRRSTASTEEGQPGRGQGRRRSRRRG